ncbi:MAG: 4Fe-4S dicluster domain-containing protein, partial [Anaerolineae bacterium]|nr:4Fe-4S dicluster domain-containing protein [Anaerolineae bacterium]
LAGIDIEHLEPLPSVEGYSAFGGYAGPGIKPVGLRCVAEIAQALPGVPIAGCGGIENWRDAVEYLCAGAWVTQIYTVVMEKGFDVIKELTAGLATYLLNKGFQRVSQLTGAILPKLIDHGALSLEYKVKASYHPDLCTRCGQCFIACEDTGFQAIRLDEQGYPRIVEENCDGCGLCVELCLVKGCMYLSNLV